MTIVSVLTVEQCLDGTAMKDITLSAPITREVIDALRTLGEVKYYGHFPRPFYTVDVPGAFSLRGVEGSQTVRMITVTGGEGAERQFATFIASANCG